MPFYWIFGFSDFPEIRKIGIPENPDFQVFRNFRNAISEGRKSLKATETEGGEFEFDLWVPRAGVRRNETELAKKENGNTKKSVKLKNKFEAFNEMEVDSVDDDGDALINFFDLQGVARKYRWVVKADFKHFLDNNNYIGPYP